MRNKPLAPCEDCGAGPGEFCKPDCIQDSCHSQAEYDKLMRSCGIHSRALTRDPRWRQDTPRKQMVSLCSSMEGDLSNMSEGIGDPGVQAERLLDTLEQIKVLVPFVEKGEW